MKKSLLTGLLCLCCLLGLMACWHLRLHPDAATSPASPAAATPASQVVLMPLDGRPPCLQLVRDSGAMADIDVVTPPGELRDYYSQPGDTMALRRWLQDNLAGRQAAILSIDQLLYGGLLAAREKEASPEQIDSLIAFLRTLHAAHPDVPLYAFSILPRLTPQDTIDGYQERRDLIAYSRLQGRAAAGEPVDQDELQRLHDAIPQSSLQRYLAHFEENKLLNEKLSQLAKEGTLHLLVLGQDDGERYSIPNIEKEALRQYLRDNSITEQQVFLTHGADEIALSLLARWQNEVLGRTPRVYTDCDQPASGTRVMPYMAVSNEETAREKIALLGGETAAEPHAADFTLFLTARDNEKDAADARPAAVQVIGKALRSGRQLALVDLSKHFAAEETILPLLLQQKLPLLQLCSYAGWNTASNAIGTATAQASLYLGARTLQSDDETAYRTEYQRIRLLANRMLEDYCYLKDGISTVNDSLKKAGYTNTADLNLEQNYRWANAMLQRDMQEESRRLPYLPALQTPFTLSLPSGTNTYRLKQLKCETSYPWPRTFEIYLETSPYIEQIQPEGNAD